MNFKRNIDKVCFVFCENGSFQSHPTLKLFKSVHFYYKGLNPGDLITDLWHRPRLYGSLCRPGSSVHGQTSLHHYVIDLLQNRKQNH